MLRIHFSADDLARIRIRADPDPLWEVLLSLHMLQTQQGTLPFGAWRRSSLSVLPPSTAMLTALARPKGYSPDFLTPLVDGADLETGLEALLSTPRRQLRADIGWLALDTAVPTWAAGIADGEPDMLRRLADGIRRYHAEALQPHWASIRAHVRADRIRRSEIAVDNGFEQVLDTLHPAVSWHPPILEVAYPVDRDLELGGRGLVFLPSFFCWRIPIMLANPDHQPVLVHPIDHDLNWWMSPKHHQSLVALLGRTRATVLQAIADVSHVNTTELARTIGISVAGASQHATVLRNAGLVTTNRHNGSAVHSLSRRGVSLLERPDQGDGMPAALVDSRQETSPSVRS